MAYRLALPMKLLVIHDIFHVSMLNNYIFDPSHILETPTIEIKDYLSYEDQPVRKLDQRDQVLRNKTKLLEKVPWSNHALEETTWELVQQIRAQ